MADNIGHVIDRPTGKIAALWRLYAMLLERERVAQKAARKKCPLPN